jgi:hypothetical protein
MFNPFVFTQTIASSIWNVTHNLGRHPVSDIWVTHNGGMEKILPKQVIHLNNNELQIVFTSNETGQARLF